VPDHLYEFAVDLARKTRPGSSESPAWLKPLVSWGAGPRAAQYLVLGAKTRAALHGSYAVRLEDIAAVADAVLRHRVMTTFTAESEGGHEPRTHQAARRRTEPGCLTGSPPNRRWTASGLFSNLPCSLVCCRCRCTPGMRCSAASQGSIVVRCAALRWNSPSIANMSRATIPAGWIGGLGAAVDRFYIKEFEADTNLRLCLLIDASGSMDFGPAGATRLDYARRLAGTLGYLAAQQGDAVGLWSMAEKTIDIPARRGASHLGLVLDQMEGIRPIGGTTLLAALHEAAEQIRQRALVVILSDLFVPPADLKHAVQHLRFPPARCGGVSSSP